jgi:hypothetical protein
LDLVVAAEEYRVVDRRHGEELPSDQIVT